MRVDKNHIEKTINESKDLITALEAVGAMYGIPASHILQDDSQQSIKVVNDTIIAPNRNNPNANTQSIVCAIGSVLDYISQRIDDKLDTFQIDAIDKDKLDTAKATSDPNKGEVIKRVETDEGDEIIVYDSGIIDRPMTRSALLKVAELKRKGEIPDKNEIPSIKNDTDSYFSDADDITVDTTPSTPEPVETNVSESVGISDSLLDVITEYDNTTHLGYDIFSEMGFDIKPTDSDFYQEAVKRKTKAIKPSDIKHLKFDNKHIINAVKYFNKARAEQDNVKFAKDLDIKKFVSSPNYSKAVHELEAQFDCHLSYKWIKDDKGTENAGTVVVDVNEEYKSPVTISKSKGFQLHGLGIWIEVWNYGLLSFAPVDMSIFGQAIVSVTLHEIFHNIASQIRSVTDSFLLNTATTMTLLVSSRSAKNKRMIINKYLDTAAKNGTLKLNPIKRIAFIKYMMLLSSMKTDSEIKRVVDTTCKTELSESEIDKTIEMYTKTYNKYRKKLYKETNPIPSIAGMVAGVLMGITGISAGIGLINVAGIISFALGGIVTATKISYSTMIDNLKKMYKEGVAFEESWCDMFAGIYNYPVTFYVQSGKKNGDDYTPNMVKDKSKLNELAALEKKIFEMLLIHYPTNSERNHAAAKLAENALKQKGIDPATRKYLTWVKDNFSSMLDTDIENEKPNQTYDPNRANDVDKHIQDIIDQGNVQVTESSV
jgi:hypothetical protein